MKRRSGWPRVRISLLYSIETKTTAAERALIQTLEATKLIAPLLDEAAAPVAVELFVVAVPAVDTAAT